MLINRTWKRGKDFVTDRAGGENKRKKFRIVRPVRYRERQQEQQLEIDGLELDPGNAI